MTAVLPVTTAEEMRCVDAAAPLPHETLIARAGGAVARTALAMLGGTYGRVVLVLAGPGSNGADGRAAAAELAAAGVHVRVVDVGRGAGREPRSLGECHRSEIDLVIDAVFGTGLRDGWQPPHVGDVPVLAVDLPSGVDADTGEIRGGALAATRTVTFGALKPGHLLGPGRLLCGRIELVDAAVVGLGDGVDREAGAYLVTHDDVTRWVPRRGADAHKWAAALRVVAGCPAMPGAARLVTAAAQRSGAGMVHLTSPGGLLTGMPTETVQQALPEGDLDARAGWLLDSLRRFRALVVGPGLGTDRSALDLAGRLAADAALPLVLDGDGLRVAHPEVLQRRPGPTVLTPHDGEFLRLTGAVPGPDRIAAVRRLAADTKSIVLLKGPTTVVADDEGACLIIDAGDERLASAGTGDVLAGLLGALLAQGVRPLHATAAAAWLHGTAARACPPGMVASDLVEMLPSVLAPFVASDGASTTPAVDMSVHGARR